MTPSRARLLALAGLVSVLVLLLANGCFSERTHGTAPIGTGAGECRIPIGSPVIGGTGALVAIRGFAFPPETLHVKPGTTVTWVNCESEGVDPHTSTADSELWQSPFLVAGAMYSYTFTAGGRFDYHCIPHPFMKGVVIVE